MFTVIQKKEKKNGGFYFVGFTRNLEVQCQQCHLSDKREVCLR